jgi:hypothetical protein
VEGPGYSKDVVGETKLDLELFAFQKSTIAHALCPKWKNCWPPVKKPFSVLQELTTQRTCRFYKVHSFFFFVSLLILFMIECYNVWNLSVALIFL